jgi:heme exporter protein C
MREKIIYALALAGGLLLARNLYVILLQLPDEAAQGAIYRIIFFHVPAAFCAFLGFFVALVSSVWFLATKNFACDAVAVATTEVGLAFGAANLISGMIWARIIWGIWWAWDARLTSMLICWLLYAGYLMLRRAIDEPTQRATLGAVFSIFAFADVPIVWFSIQWWRTQHPGPVLRGSGTMDPAMKATLYWNFLAMALVAVILVLIRLRQEQTQREIASLRRLAHAM